jgi:hypothetical protein
MGDTHHPSELRFEKQRLVLKPRAHGMALLACKRHAMASATF